MIEVLWETHEPPDWAVERMTRLGGLNRFGEPLLRVVWSNSRLGWIGGKFEDRNEAGDLIREVLTMRRMPKYPIENRWLVEQWVAPEKFGSPESWLAKTKEYGEEGNIPQLGPYPERGDYQLSCVLETEERRFIQLSSDLLDDVAAAWRLKRQIGYMEGVLADKNAMEKAKQKRIDDGVEFLNADTPAFYGKPAVAVL